MPSKATKSVESQIQELRQVAAKRLILVVLDGGYSSVLSRSHVLVVHFLFFVDICPFSVYMSPYQICGTQSTSGHSHVSTLALRQSFWWYGGFMLIRFSLISVSAFRQLASKVSCRKDLKWSLSF